MEARSSQQEASQPQKPSAQPSQTTVRPSSQQREVTTPSIPSPALSPGLCVAPDDIQTVADHVRSVTLEPVKAPMTSGPGSRRSESLGLGKARYKDAGTDTSTSRQSQHDASSKLQPFLVLRDMSGRPVASRETDVNRSFLKSVEREFERTNDGAALVDLYINSFYVSEAQTKIREILDEELPFLLAMDRLQSYGMSIGDATFLLTLVKLTGESFMG